MGRFLNIKRENEIKTACVGLNQANIADGSTVCIGHWANPAGVDVMIVGASIIFGADIAQDGAGATSKQEYELFDRKADGSGTTQVGSTIDNDSGALADDIEHDFGAFGYVLKAGYVLGVEVTCTDNSSSSEAKPAATLVVRYIEWPNV